MSGREGFVMVSMEGDEIADSVLGRIQKLLIRMLSN